MLGHRAIGGATERRIHTWCGGPVLPPPVDKQKLKTCTYKQNLLRDGPSTAKQNSKYTRKRQNPNHLVPNPFLLRLREVAKSRIVLQLIQVTARAQAQAQAEAWKGKGKVTAQASVEG